MYQDVKQLLLWILRSYVHSGGSLRKLRLVLGACRAFAALAGLTAVAAGVKLSWMGWLRSGRAVHAIDRHDRQDVDLAELVHGDRAPLVPGQLLLTEAGEDAIREYPPRFRPRRFEQLASALAWECYAHFGARERSEANVLVSRKYMRDILDEHRDFRAKDKARLIDRALLLSFLPTQDLQEMVELSSTSVWKSREAVALVPARGFFSRLFNFRGGSCNGVVALVTAPSPTA